MEIPLHKECLWLLCWAAWCSPLFSGRWWRMGKKDGEKLWGAGMPSGEKLGCWILRETFHCVWIRGTWTLTWSGNQMELNPVLTPSVSSKGEPWPHLFSSFCFFTFFFFLGLTIKCTNLKCMVQLIFNEWISAKPPPWSKWRTFLAYLGPLPSQPHPLPKGNLYSNVYNHCLVLPVLKLYIIRTGAWMVLFVSEIDP